MQCVSLNDDVDPIVRRARSKLSMRWRYAEAQATVLLYDGFAVLDHERPDRRLQAGWQRQRLVRRERRPGRQRHALPLVARFTNDRWDNTVGVCDQFDTRLDDGALGSFHGLRRVTQFVQWAAPPRSRARHAGPAGASCASPSRVQLATSRPLRAVRARSSNSACCRWRAASTRPLSRSWLHTFRSFTTARSLFDCFVDRFGKPLRRFNALAPLDARLSGSQHNAIVSRTRAQVCYVLDSWLRHYARTLADSELFADCCAEFDRFL
jgi:hypothetical protein